MNYNLLIEIRDVTPENGNFLEPVSIDEVKSYLRLEGFIDTTESLSTDFDDDDKLISQLIVSARKRLEEYTGLSFINKKWEMEFDNYAGNFPIPNGPVQYIVELLDSEQNEILPTEYKLSAGWGILKYPTWGEMVMTYYGGYEELPAPLKEAILKEVAYRYMNRGDVNIDAISKEAIALASPYKQTMTWLG